LKRIYHATLAEQRPGEFIETDRYLGNYIFTVLRMKQGDEFLLFNQQFECRVKAGGNNRAPLEILAFNTHEPNAFSTQYALSLPLMKGNNLRESVKKVMEVGVDQISFTQYDRCVKKATDGDKLLEQLTLWCGQAAQQCCALIPEILPVFENCQEMIAGTKGCKERLFLSPEAEDSLANYQPTTNSVFITSGPEGGFTPQEELLMLENGFKAVCLNTNILRTETAPVVALAVLRHLQQPTIQEAK
jgi:16S rRNA (uracil1498-N3)-methyltransferase